MNTILFLLICISVVSFTLMAKKTSPVPVRFVSAERRKQIKKL